MAEAGDQKEHMCETFKNFVQSASVGKTLTEDQKKEMNDKAMNKMIKECCGDAVAKVSDAQVFYAVAGKTKKIKMDQFDHFVDELACTIIHNEMQKKDRAAKKPKTTDQVVVDKANVLKAKIAAKHDATKKVAEVSGVTKRLTDTKGYTGAHRERFDESGKGMGAAGREDRSDGSGYVTGYKNKDTYQTKK